MNPLKVMALALTLAVVLSPVNSWCVPSAGGSAVHPTRVPFSGGFYSARPDGGNLSATAKILQQAVVSDECGTQAHLSVTFSGNASGGSPPYSFTWNFGDGTANGYGAQVTHEYATPSRYNVSLLVGDSLGKHAYSNLTVESGPPGWCYNPISTYFQILIYFGLPAIAASLILILVLRRRARQKQNKQPQLLRT